MSLVSSILLVACLASLALAGYVFWRRHTRPLHFAFAFMVLASALWNASVFLVSVAENLSVVAAVGRVAFATAVCTGFGCVVFSWFFPEVHHVRPRRATVALVCLLSAIVLVLSCTDLVQASVILGDNGKRPVMGPAHPLYVLYMVGAFFLGFWNLFRARLQTPSGRERMQLNYCLTGLALSFIPAFVANFVLPFVTSRSDYYLLGASSTLCWTSFTFYAIFRHRLMDIGVALRNTAVYGIMALVLAMLFQIPVLVYVNLMAGASAASAALICVLLAVTLAVSVMPLHRAVTLFVDQRLFQGRYDHRSALLRVGNVLSRTYGRDNLARRVAEEIPIVMQSQGGVVYLADTDGSVSLSASSGHTPADLPAHLPGDHPLIGELRTRGAAVLREEVASGADQGERVRARLDALGSTGAAVAQPLLCQEHFLGVLFLGERSSGDMFTADDLGLLGALGSQAATALDNSRLYEEIVASQRHYATILRHMQVGVLTVGSRLRITTLNEAAAGILKAGEEGWLGRPVGDLVPEFGPLLATTLGDGGERAETEVGVRVAGEVIPCGCATSALLDPRNRVTGALAVFQDLREKKRLESQVRRMDRLASIGTLAAGMAHEIKNPLVSIQTFAQLLPERHADTDFRESFGKVVLSEVTRINTLVEDLLNLARPRQSQVCVVDLSRLLSRSLLLLANEFRRNEVAVVWDDHRDDLLVRADPEQLHQVFLNLLRNACEAMEAPPRRVHVVAERATALFAGERKEAVRIRLTDSGVGIAPDVIPHVFDPFYSTKESGHGLGLAICHRILDEHGARIEVESQLGAGTTFALTFPLATPSGPGAVEGSP